MTFLPLEIESERAKMHMHRMLCVQLGCVKEFYAQEKVVMCDISHEK